MLVQVLGGNQWSSIFVLNKMIDCHGYNYFRKYACKDRIDR